MDTANFSPAPLTEPTYAPPAPEVVSPSRFSSFFTSISSTKSGVILFIPFCLAALVYIFIAISPPKVARTVTAVGTAKLKFQASRVQLSVLYLKRGNKNDIATQSKNEFNSILSKISSYTASVSQSAPQILPIATSDNLLGNGTYEYRQGAQIILSDSQTLSDVSSILSQEANLVVAETRYLPDEDTSIKDKLTSEAMNDAYKNAVRIASTNKQHVGKVISATENNGADNGSLVSSTKKDSTSPGNYSEIELAKYVSVTYELY